MHFCRIREIIFLTLTYSSKGALNIKVIPRQGQLCYRQMSLFIDTENFLNDVVERGYSNNTIYTIRLHIVRYCNNIEYPQKWRIVLRCYISYISFWISTFCSFIVSLDYCLLLVFLLQKKIPLATQKLCCQLHNLPITRMA